jgi:hypothetical protein
MKLTLHSVYFLLFTMITGLICHSLLRATGLPELARMAQCENISLKRIVQLPFNSVPVLLIHYDAYDQYLVQGQSS